MQGGRLRKQVTIQHATVVQDEFGQPIETWANVTTNPTVWASIMSKASGERFITGGEQLQAEISHTVRMRYRADLSVQMRLVWVDIGGTRHLMIENIVDPDGRLRELVLMCREVQV
jgi:SPP1 family predicted phage head-tail adaptor